MQEVAEPLRSELIERATKAASERGFSLDGLTPWASDRGAFWRVSFSGPYVKGERRNQGFVVKMAKDGKAPPEILRFQ